MVNVRVKSRISNQESSVDEDEMRLERRDTMDARDPAGDVFVHSLCHFLVLFQG